MKNVETETKIGLTQLNLHLAVRKAHKHNIETMFAAIRQDPAAYAASRSEEPCPDCGAAPREECRVDCSCRWTES